MLCKKINLILIRFCNKLECLSRSVTFNLVLHFLEKLGAYFKNVVFFEGERCSLIKLKSILIPICNKLECLSRSVTRVVLHFLAKLGAYFKNKGEWCFLKISSQY